MISISAELSGDDVMQAGGEGAVRPQHHLVPAVAVHHPARAGQERSRGARLVDPEPERHRERPVPIEEADLLAGADVAVAHELLRLADLAGNGPGRAILVTDAAALLRVHQVLEDQQLSRFRRPFLLALRIGLRVLDERHRAIERVVGDQSRRLRDRRAHAGTSGFLGAPRQPGLEALVEAGMARDELRLEGADAPGKGGELRVDLGIRHDDRRARHAGIRNLAALVDVVEIRVEPVELLLRDRVVLVVVAAGALDAQSRGRRVRTC